MMLVMSGLLATAKIVPVLFAFCIFTVLWRNNAVGIGSSKKKEACSALGVGRLFGLSRLFYDSAVIYVLILVVSAVRHDSRIFAAHPFDG